MPNVIKARMLEPSGQPAVVKRNVQVALREAGAIVAQAKGEAQAIVDDARAKAQCICDSAREDGYQSGVAKWYGALEEAWKSRDKYLAANESTLLILAVRIAGKIIGDELRTSPDTVAKIAKEALLSARRARHFTIQAHPADAVFLEEHLAVLRTPAGIREIEIVPNDSLSRGDCLVETDIGTIDARLETQLKNMESALVLKG